jgi:hypothetical protein
VYRLYLLTLFPGSPEFSEEMYRLFPLFRDGSTRRALNADAGVDVGEDEAGGVGADVGASGHGLSVNAAVPSMQQDERRAGPGGGGSEPGVRAPARGTGVPTPASLINGGTAGYRGVP